MPVLRLDADDSRLIAARLEELEAEGNRIVGAPTVVADGVIVVYEKKPKIGRPPKTETR